MIMVDGLPVLNNVLFVADLKANVIFVGQLCDNDLMVMYTKSTCKVLKNYGNCILRGVRSSDRCYFFESKILCHFSKDDFISVAVAQTLGTLEP